MLGRQIDIKNPSKITGVLYIYPLRNNNLELTVRSLIFHIH